MFEQILKMLAENGVLVGFICVTFVWFFFLRTRATSLTSKADFDRMIEAGKPVIAEFFSNG